MKEEDEARKAKEDAEMRGWRQEKKKEGEPIALDPAKLQAGDK